MQKVMDTCAICRFKYDKLCLECKNCIDTGLPSMSLCDTVTGRYCGHTYHRHCITTWLRLRKLCPLDTREWRSNEIESLQTLCVRELVTTPSNLIQLACNPVSNDPEISQMIFNFTKPFEGDIDVDIKVASALGTAFQNFALDAQYSMQLKIVKDRQNRE